MHAQRVAVIGSPGSGKSTVARAPAASLALPRHHLDRL
jgi:adenylate kinase family enzyme